MGWSNAQLPVLFFFQAEDGIRDVAVTGVQTCALPISFCDSTLTVAVRLMLLGVLLAWVPRIVRAVVVVMFWLVAPFKNVADPLPLVVEREIGRGSCRERV